MEDHLYCFQVTCPPVIDVTEEPYMNDHMYCARVMRPPVIVVKEEPIWKLANKEGTMGVTDEEPELEWAVCKNVVDIGEDPLLMSDTEESSLFVENSVSSRSNDGKNIKSSCTIKKEKIHVADISQLNDGNISKEDNDSLDLEVAELLQRNNAQFNGFKKDDRKFKEEIEDNENLVNVDESLGNDETSATDERQFKSIFQSFFKKELSPKNIDLVKINEIKNRKSTKKKSVNKSPDLLLKNSYTQVEVKSKNNTDNTGISFNNKDIIDGIKLKLDLIKSCNKKVKNEEILTKNSHKYSLRKSRPILKRYSPVDFNETINKTFKKSNIKKIKTNNENTSVLLNKDINYEIKMKLDKMNETRQKVAIKSSNLKVKNKEIITKSSINRTFKNSGNSSASFNNREMIREIKLKLEKINEIRQRDAIKSCNSEVKREEINIKNRSQIYSLRKSKPVKKRYSPVDFNKIKTNDYPFNKDTTNYTNEIRQKDAVNNKFNIEFDYYVNGKLWHNIEKHRRTLLSELYNNLSNEFPSKLKLSTKMSKVHVLNKALVYINELKHREEYLVKTINALKDKQKYLQERVEKLRKLEEKMKLKLSVK